MNSIKASICNKLWLHVRAATLFVQSANEYDSEITISANDQSADAKSIMEVLMLAATNGTDVVLRADGDPSEEE